MVRVTDGATKGDRTLGEGRTEGADPFGSTFTQFDRT
jgi:hypothetical protein